MAQKKTETAETAVAAETAETATRTVVVDNDHDRIVMASISKDGTLDQLDPEFIGGDFSIAASKRQAEERAVSIVDQNLRGVTSDVAATVAPGEPDPEIQKIKDAQEKAANAASLAAEKLVKANSGK